MADILTLAFRTFGSRTCQGKDSPAGPPPPAPRSVLTVGDRRVSRSLLLLSALTAASEMGIRVAFFAQTQIKSLPVSLQRCVPSLSPESLKKITFTYPRTFEELLQHVAGLHESPTPPSLIIVDRLEDFLRGPAAGAHSGAYGGFQWGQQPSGAARLAALLCDTSAFLSCGGSGSAPCRLIASFLSDADGGGGQDGGDSSATDPTLDVLDRYFQARCTLDQDRGYAATGAGAEEAWNIYLSERGATEFFSEKEVKTHGTQEWQLFIFPDSSMEFKLAST
ncbi:unnamed protein product [Menidia menidia]|uniref:(Atlantic silverside) hypothetical protein n=1 Tax=Menidia menidia TaxID=238744 RepID=A0A8S4AT99_9TELE|nr:unnamed protein product [Menidia menidia]CAG5896304.1 unnamed protein product [Menidia menidia]CAG5896307.1 unnamed protein product [Menidia menidia]CAG5896310.1 unnamed protein product [Menidia menidia]